MGVFDGNKPRALPTTEYVTQETLDAIVAQMDANFKSVMELISKISIPKYNTFEMRFGEIQYAVTGEKEQFDQISAYMNKMADRIIKLIKEKALQVEADKNSIKTVKFDDKGYN